MLTILKPIPVYCHHKACNFTSTTRMIRCDSPKRNISARRGGRRPLVPWEKVADTPPSGMWPSLKYFCNINTRKDICTVNYGRRHPRLLLHFKKIWKLFHIKKNFFTRHKIQQPSPRPPTPDSPPWINLSLQLRFIYRQLFRPGHGVRGPQVELHGYPSLYLAVPPHPNYQHIPRSLWVYWGAPTHIKSLMFSFTQARL